MTAFTDVQAVIVILFWHVFEKVCMQKGGFGCLFLLSKVKNNAHFYFSKVKECNFTERKTEIKDIQNSFVVTDNMEIGHGNKIPLWLFGLLY